jgi:hypothetical protein
VREYVLDILRTQPDDRAHWLALTRGLAEHLASIKHRDTYLSALEVVSRLVSPALQQTLPEIFNILLLAAQRPDWQPTAIDTVLHAVCRRLATIEDEALVFQVLERIIDVVGTREDPEPDDALHSAESILRSILELAKKQRDPSRLKRLLEWVMRRAVHMSNERFKAEVLSNALAHGSRYLPAADAMELLGLGVALSEPVVEPDSQRRLLVAMAQVAAETMSHEGAEPLLETLLNRLTAQATEPSMQTIAETAVYRTLAEHQPNADLTHDLARRIKEQGTPVETTQQARWAANLATTPLEPLAYPIFEELLSNLARFTMGAAEFWAFEVFLRAAATIWSTDEVIPRFEALIAWVARMPLVTNEDWRDAAFASIMLATVDLPSSHRASVQTLTVERAFAVLDRYGREGFGRRLLGFSMDLQVAEHAIELYLQSAMLPDGQSAEEMTPADHLLDLIIRNLEHDPEQTNESLFQAFCSQLDRCAEKPRSVARAKLARIASLCAHSPLRRRLDAVLHDQYSAAGLPPLEEDDLNHLVARPRSWWIERSLGIDVARVDRRVSVRWIDRGASISPGSANWMTILASEWMARHKPDELQAFWLEIATSVAPVRLDVRATIAEALTANPNDG